MSRFDTTHHTLGGAIYAVDLDALGEGTLAITIGGDGQKLDCTPWLWLKADLAVAFAHAFCKHNLTLAHNSRRTNHEYLANGFFRWLISARKKGQIGFTEFNITLFDAFDLWIKEKDGQGKYKHAALGTLLHYRSALKGPVDLMKDLDKDGLLPDNCRLRRGVLRARESQANKFEPYSIEDFSNMLSAVRFSVKEMIQYFDDREKLLAKGHAYLDARSAKRRPEFQPSAKALLLAKLQRVFGPVLPALKDIREAESDLFDEIQDFGASEILPILQPSTKELLPFAMQIAFLSGFNAKPLWNLEFGRGVRIVRAFGCQRVVFSSDKSRQGREVIASYVDTDEAMSAPYIIRRVKKWTDGIRSVAETSIQNDVWLFVPRHNARDRVVRSMRVNDTDRINVDVNNAITAFAKKSSLPRFAPARVRATLAQLATDLFGGDIRAVMEFLQHRNPEVTLRNYTNGISVARHHEVIAVVQQLRERWLVSDGRLDPRVLAESGDPGAATPGWQCHNPLKSPIPGQLQGRLCRAYGSCPTCPLARVDITSPVACARVLQVKGELEAAKHRVLPERWARSLALQHAAIREFWQEAFPSAIREQAARIALSKIVPFE